MIKPFRGNFILTQGFGGNKASYIQFGLQGHNGLDYGLPTATQVIAPHSGKIIETGDEGTKGYGKYIKIENAKEGSVLAHLQSFQIKVGDQVSEGQPLAFSDNTGNSTGPHLHWGYYLFPRNRQNGYAGFIDQLPLIAAPVTPVSVTPLPVPNPGYAPTFEGQTVAKDGITYQSYKKDAQLLWKIKESEDWEKKYRDEVQAHGNTRQQLNDRISKYHKALESMAQTIEEVRNI